MMIHSSNTPANVFAQPVPEPGAALASSGAASGSEFIADALAWCDELLLAIDPLIVIVGLALILALTIVSVIGWAVWILRPRTGEPRVTRDAGFLICPSNMRRVPDAAPYHNKDPLRRSLMRDHFEESAGALAPRSADAAGGGPTAIPSRPAAVSVFAPRRATPDAVRFVWWRKTRRHG